MERYNLKSSLEFGQTLKEVSDYNYRRLRDNYDALLQRPLTLQMFVPCDKNGNYFLEIPHKKSYKDYFSGKWQSYEDGKERVLFHGFNYNSQEQTIEYGGGCWSFDKNDIENQTIESFGGIEYKIELTSSAIKQIGL